MSGPLKIELQAVVSFPAWLLEPQLWSSERTSSVLHFWSEVLNVILCKFYHNYMYTYIDICGYICQYFDMCIHINI